MTGPVDGSCLCGAVRFRLSAAPATFQYCHCGQCRKASGTACTANGTVPAGAFELLGGAAWLRAWESSPGVRRHFCGRCGSPVHKTRDDDPGTVRVRLGLLDDPCRPRATAHIWTGHAAPWHVGGEDGLPRHPGPAPPAEDDRRT